MSKSECYITTLYIGIGCIAILHLIHSVYYNDYGLPLGSSLLYVCFTLLAYITNKYIIKVTAYKLLITLVFISCVCTLVL